MLKLHSLKLRDLVTAQPFLLLLEDLGGAWKRTSIGLYLRRCFTSDNIYVTEIPERQERVGDRGSAREYPFFLGLTLEVMSTGTHHKRLTRTRVPFLFRLRLDPRGGPWIRIAGPSLQYTS